MSVDDAATRRVRETSIAVFDEELLDDSLVDNEERELGSPCRLIVDLIEGCLELRDLAVDDL